MSFVKSRKEFPGSCSFPWATVSAHFAASAGIIIEASVSTNALVAAVRGVRSSNSWASNSGKDQVLLGIPRTSPLQNICDCLSRDWLGVSLCRRDFETSGIAETYCLRWSSVARAHHQDEPHHLSLPPFCVFVVKDRFPAHRNALAARFFNIRLVGDDAPVNKKEWRWDYLWCSGCDVTDISHCDFCDVTDNCSFSDSFETTQFNDPLSESFETTHFNFKLKRSFIQIIWKDSLLLLA